MEDIYILAIESSCDETSAAVVKNGREVLSNVISSQIDIHKVFGGVVPEIASRKHIEAIDTVVDEAIKNSLISLDDITAISATCGPGLVGAVLVGLSTAKAMAYALNKPFLGVHHIEGHIAANYIENLDWEPPFICLIVSGGHTHLVKITDYNEFEIFGKTRDDAAGEAFDKIARAIGLPYPGGPQIDKLAKKGNPQAMDFPRVMLEPDSYDFSFSGLKSGVLNYINKCKMSNTPFEDADIAASFQQAVVDVLVKKTIRLCKNTGIKKVAMAGGVSANSFLRYEMEKACAENGFKLNVPKPILCTDNAAMIGCAAYYEYIKGARNDLSLNAYPGLKLGEKFY